MNTYKIRSIFRKDIQNISTPNSGSVYDNMGVHGDKITYCRFIWIHGAWCPVYVE